MEHKRQYEEMMDEWRDISVLVRRSSHVRNTETYFKEIADLNRTGGIFSPEHIGACLVPEEIQGGHCERESMETTAD